MHHSSGVHSGPGSLPELSGGANRSLAPERDDAADEDEDEEQHEPDQVENQTKRCDHAAEAEGLQKEQWRARIETHPSHRGKTPLLNTSTPAANAKRLPKTSATLSTA